MSALQRLTDWLAKASSYEAGVHKPQSRTSGNSAAGQATRSHASAGPATGRKPEDKRRAIDAHQKVISEMRAMKKPNLPKSEDSSDDDSPLDRLAAFVDKAKGCYDDGDEPSKHKAKKLKKDTPAPPPPPKSPASSISGSFISHGGTGGFGSWGKSAKPLDRLTAWLAKAVKNPGAFPATHIHMDSGERVHLRPSKTGGFSVHQPTPSREHPNTSKMHGPGFKHDDNVSHHDVQDSYKPIGLHPQSRLRGGRKSEAQADDDQED